MSQCRMKDKIAKSDWAIKKGPQPVQDMNDDANEDKSEKSEQVESQSTNDEKKHPRKHWTGVQMETPQLQGFQTDFEHCRPTIETMDEVQHLTCVTRRRTCFRTDSTEEHQEHWIVGHRIDI